MMRHIIDCHSNPSNPRIGGVWGIKEHVKGGELVWNPDEVELYLCDEQKGGTIVGHELRKKLEGQLVLNANVLYYLLANPRLIPEEWKYREVFFWGTIYNHPFGGLYVSCLYWDWDSLSEPSWQSKARCLSDNWDGRHVAVLSRK